jgi:hypothetical protein
MTQPFEYYAVVRDPAAETVFVVGVTVEMPRGVMGRRIDSSRRLWPELRYPAHDVVADFASRSDAEAAAAAYNARFLGFSDIIERAEMRLALERRNRAASAMDALMAFLPPPLDVCAETSQRLLSNDGGSVAEETPIEPGCAPGGELPPFNREQRNATELYDVPPDTNTQLVKLSPEQIAYIASRRNPRRLKNGE